jgi:hypothetical protein
MVDDIPMKVDDHACLDPERQFGDTVCTRPPVVIDVARPSRQQQFEDAWHCFGVDQHIEVDEGALWAAERFCERRTLDDRVPYAGASQSGRQFNGGLRHAQRDRLLLASAIREFGRQQIAGGVAEFPRDGREHPVVIGGVRYTLPLRVGQLRKAAQSIRVVEAVQ